MKILISGFEPFGNDTYNPSMEVLKRLPDFRAGTEIKKAVLPVVRFESLRIMEDLIEAERPDAVVSLGLAAGRKGITIERTAVNIDDFRIRDNGSNQPHDERIIKDAPDAWFTSLPYRKLIAALNEKGIQASLSESAGTFVCNHVFFGVRNYCMQNHPEVISGFIHLPCTDEMGKSDLPEMPMDMIVKAMLTVIEVLAGTQS